VFSWQAEGSQELELQNDGKERPQPYLRLALHGAAWLECQRCLAPYRQAFDIDAAYRIVNTEEEANAFALDDDELDVIVGSHHFDLLDLIGEELLLALPLVPKHDVCPTVHESLVSGADGSLGVDSVDDLPRDAPENASAGDARPQPFAALAALKRNGAGGPD